MVIVFGKEIEQDTVTLIRIGSGHDSQTPEHAEGICVACKEMYDIKQYKTLIAHIIINNMHQ